MTAYIAYVTPALQYPSHQYLCHHRRSSARQLIKRALSRCAARALPALRIKLREAVVIGSMKKKKAAASAA